MGLSDARVFFGVHSCSFINRTTGEPYGTLKVLKQSSLEVSGESIELTAGSSKYPWAVESGKSSAKLSLTFDEYPSFVYELFLGKKPTENGAAASGSISTLTDKSGLMVDAVTGVASVGIKAGNEADLKFTKYVVKYVSADTVDVFAYSDVDFARGTDTAFENDLLKITATPLTMTSSAVEVPDYGIELTGGSGTIAIPENSTATFEVIPVSSDSTEVVIGGSSDVYPEFECIVHGSKLGSDEIVELDVFRCQATGMGFGFSESEFSESEIEITAFYDSAKNGVFSQRTFKA